MRARPEPAEAAAETEKLQAEQAVARKPADSTAVALAAAEDAVREARGRLDAARTASAEAAAGSRETGRAGRWWGRLERSLMLATPSVR
ncbi:hypothetical protein [Streptomyces sp. NPDC002467]|uniref:hypothetical protein n=1 Tax=Streptomyces sp. NPDC002467 TaxID=3364647 RepID=UPI00367ABD18